MPQSKSQILQETFLSVRAKLLEIAAILDRIDRAESINDGKNGDEKITDDLRLIKLRQGIHLLLSESNDQATRAELLQLLFSRSYDENWPQHYSLNIKR